MYICRTQDIIFSPLNYRDVRSKVCFNCKKFSITHLKRKKIVISSVYLEDIPFNIMFMMSSSIIRIPELTYYQPTNQSILPLLPFRD